MPNNHAIPPPPRYHTGSSYEEDRGEPSQVVVKIEGAAPSPATSTAPKMRSNGNGTGWIKIVTLAISLISVTAAAAVWNVQQHDEIKTTLTTQDTATKKELVEDSEKRYVPKDDFVEVKTEQKYIKEKVDKIDIKLDEMHKLLTEEQRRRRNDR